MLRFRALKPYFNQPNQDLLNNYFTCNRAEWEERISFVLFYNVLGASVF
jgi:hypothetical protein